MMPNGSSSSFPNKNIKVFARIRPALNEEVNVEKVLSVDGSNLIIDARNSGRKTALSYKFDRVFEEDSSQKDVFEELNKAVEVACEGFNSSILAYGQTGTGKTHTMLGHDIWELVANESNLEPSSPRSRPHHPNHLSPHKSSVVSSSLPSQLYDTSPETRMCGSGLIPRIIKKIFSIVEEEGSSNFEISCSYMEIYNDRIYDLLTDENSRLNRCSLDIREDKKKGVVVTGISQIVVQEWDEALQVLWHGAHNRAIRATDVNERSSRSHTLFQITIDKTKSNHRGETIITSAKINLVDLAGSEKINTLLIDEMDQQHFKELSSINQSLSSLGNCVAAILNPQKKHIPYRNSKLTRLLKDSLGGNALTFIIVTLSPSTLALEESISTLHFSDMARKVTVYPMSYKRIENTIYCCGSNKKQIRNNTINDEDDRFLKQETNEEEMSSNEMIQMLQQENAALREHVNKLTQYLVQDIEMKTRMAMSFSLLSKTTNLRGRGEKIHTRVGNNNISPKIHNLSTMQISNPCASSSSSSPALELLVSPSSPLSSPSSQFEETRKIQKKRKENLFDMKKNNRNDSIFERLSLVENSILVELQKAQTQLREETKKDPSSQLEERTKNYSVDDIPLSSNHLHQDDDDVETQDVDVDEKEWEVHLDPSSGCNYYHNKRTQVTQWENPYVK